jgi:hypothetical protein
MNAAKRLAAVALVAVTVAACTSGGDRSVRATFDIFGTPKRDCGPWSCRISFTLSVETNFEPGDHNLYRCHVEALDEKGGVVAGGSLQASPGTVGRVPSDHTLSPRERRAVAAIEGTCAWVDPAEYA